MSCTLLYVYRYKYTLIIIYLSMKHTNMVGIHIDFFQQNCCFNSQRWKVLGISKPNVNYLCSKYHIVLLHTFIDNHPNLSLHDMNHPNLRWCYNPYNTCDFDGTLLVSTIPNTYLGSCEACSEGIS